VSVSGPALQGALREVLEALLSSAHGPALIGCDLLMGGAFPGFDLRDPKIWDPPETPPSHNGAPPLPVEPPSSDHTYARSRPEPDTPPADLATPTPGHAPFRLSLATPTPGHAPCMLPLATPIPGHTLVQVIAGHAHPGYAHCRLHLATPPAS
ncbi:hypothetical protein HGM15179_022221, partial [Zosterops borbonicus]